MSRNYTFFYFISLSMLFFAECYGRINFLHVPKCGGSTIHELLVRKFPEQSVYPHRIIDLDAMGIKYNSKDLSECLQKHPYMEAHNLILVANPTVNENVLFAYPMIKEAIVSAHFPFWFFKNKDEDFDSSFFLICLRDPLQRVLSEFRYWKLIYPDITEYLPSVIFAPNLICRMLSSDPALKGEELLKNAIDNLARMDYIIFQEDLENDIKFLFAQLEIPCDEKIKTINPTNYEEVSEEEIEKINQANRLDIQLFEYAIKNYKGKIKSLENFRKTLTQSP